MAAATPPPPTGGRRSSPRLLTLRMSGTGPRHRGCTGASPAPADPGVSAHPALPWRAFPLGAAGDPALRGVLKALIIKQLMELTQNLRVPAVLGVKRIVFN